MPTTTQPSSGLEDVIAGSSGICYIDGDKGILAYRGIDIHELADNSTFEEVTYLLWFGKLPTRTELQEFNLFLVRERKLDAQIVRLIRKRPNTRCRWTCCAASSPRCDSSIPRKDPTMPGPTSANPFV